MSMLPKKASFVYVDFDFYEPIPIALYYFYGTIGVAAKIIIDDYDWFSTGPKQL